MKKITLLLFSLCICFGGCQKFDSTDIWENINSLDERVTSLEKMCRDMNTNIESLQVLVKALQEQDYITNISPVTEDGKVVGYTITFAHNDTITIYHGKDGQDGANGADGSAGEDGYTPNIGIMQDSDGIYYWTLDGDWLLDGNGNKVVAVGRDGADGEDGVDGAPGQNGITPRFKIENGMWYVSYDNGSNWELAGQATGDKGDIGEQGPQGPTGDSFFQSVTQDDKYVYLVLADGTEINIPREQKEAVSMSLGEVTGFTATFNGSVNRTSLDLKVTVYYSTTNSLTVYKHTGSTSLTEFPSESFTLRLTGLAANTTYYYFIETLSNGVKSFSEVSSFRTGEPDSYVDWEEGENVGDEI